MCVCAVPDQDVVEAMRQREDELSRTKLVQRACSLLCSDRVSITRQIQLRVVREFGLPDSTVEVLRNAVAAAAFGSEFQRSSCHDSGGNLSILVGSNNPAAACHVPPPPPPAAVVAATAAAVQSQHCRPIQLLSSPQKHRHLDSTDRRGPLVLAPCPVFEASFFL